MRTLHKAIKEYLTLRRQLGFKLDRAELWLRQFAHFMEDEGAPCITTDLARKIREGTRMSEKQKPLS